MAGRVEAGSGRWAVRAHPSWGPTDTREGSAGIDGQQQPAHPLLLLLLLPPPPAVVLRCWCGGVVARQLIYKTPCSLGLVH